MAVTFRSPIGRRPTRREQGFALRRPPGPRGAYKESLRRGGRTQNEYQQPATVKQQPALWQQSDNVPFEQSRNVPLTAPSFGDARRTTTDDASRSRPAGDAEESQEETDYAARGSRGTGVEHSAGEAPAECLEEARRPGGGPQAARSFVQPADRREDREAGGEDLVSSGVRRVWADLGCGISKEEARDRGAQRDGAAVDDTRQAMARQEREGQAGALLAAAAKPLWGPGAMGHQRTRVAGRAGREALPDRHDRRCHQPIIRAIRAA